MLLARELYYGENVKRSQKVQSDRVSKEKFVRTQFPVLLPKNESQRQFSEGLKYNTLIVAHGSAGTGKTIMACYHAARKLHFGDIKKIVLVRAYQALAGRSIGFLPGTVDEKLQPYYQQMIDYLEDCLGKASVEIALKNKVIEICPLETIRGRSWDDAIIIVDEAQNLYVQEIQALTTRMGENCQMIIVGDNTQNDQKQGSITGLEYLERLISKYSITDTCFVKFTSADVVRSGITKEFVLAFEAEVEAGSKDIISERKKNEKQCSK